MHKFLKPTILSLSFLLIMTSSTVSPALAQIAKSFPKANDQLIKLILTLPALVLIPISLLSGKIASRVKKRKIIIVGLILYSVGGFGGGCCDSLLSLLSFRVLLGIGLGLIMPLSRSLIADFFIADERTHLMGLSNAIANFGSIFATLTAGWLATIHWRYVFYIYLIAVPILILVFLYLPEPKPRPIASNIRMELNSHVMIIAFFAILLNIAFYSVVTNIAFFLEAEHIGHARSAGYSMSLLTLAGFLSGLFLKKITQVLNNFHIALGVGSMGSGFILLSAADRMVLIFFAVFLIGFGLGIIKPLLFLKITEVLPRHSNAFALSIISSSLYFGKFLSPFVLAYVQKLIGQRGYRANFFIVALGLFSIMTIALFTQFRARKKAW